jgi:hypothetical protein
MLIPVLLNRCSVKSGNIIPPAAQPTGFVERGFEKDEIYCEGLHQFEITAESG